MSEGNEQRTLAAFFKQVDGGYVYRAPSGWLLSRRRHFLVSAVLRERLIAASEELSWVVALWFAVPWLVVSCIGVFALAFYFDGRPDSELALYAGGLVSAFVGFVAGLAAVAEHKWRRVAPLLRDATPTEQSISQRELAAGILDAGGPSKRAMFTQILSGAFLLAVGAFNGGSSIQMITHSGRVIWPQLISSIVMVVGGFCLLFVAARNLAKKKD